MGSSHRTVRTYGTNRTFVAICFLRRSNGDGDATAQCRYPRRCPPACRGRGQRGADPAVRSCEDRSGQYRPDRRRRRGGGGWAVARARSEEHTSELQSLMRISYAVFCLKKKKNKRDTTMI